MDHITAVAAPARRFVVIAALTCLSFCLAVAAHAATFTVTTTADAGAGSLRWAIEQANQQAGPDAIRFNLPGTGVKTISPRTPLPAVTDTVTIDAATQPGYAGAPLVALDGYYALIPGQWPAEGWPGLALTGGSGSVLRGLCIKRFFGPGIRIGVAAANTRVEGCYIGTDPAGAAARGNYGSGIVAESAGNTIGGSLPSQRCVISGNRNSGIRLGAFPIAIADGNNVVRGNYIGTDARGGGGIANGMDGIEVRNGRNQVGGDNPADGNVVSGNQGCGISLWGRIETRTDGGVTETLAAAAAYHNVVKNNKIGTDVSGRLPLGNRLDGVLISVHFERGTTETDAARARCHSNTIGSTTAGNVIAYNGQRGVAVSTASTPYPAAMPDRNAIVGNAIYKNRGLNIDLSLAWPYANDPLDADRGANGAQNSPVVESSVLETNATRIAYSLHSAPNTRFTLHFYHSTERGADMSGDGEKYLGAVSAATDAAGNTRGTSWLARVPAGSYITATATDENGNTSMFSRAVSPFQATLTSFTPTSGSPGTMVTINGTRLSGVTRVSFGRVAATDVTVVSDTQLKARVPSGALTNRIEIVTPYGWLATTDEFTVIVSLAAQDLASLADGGAHVLRTGGAYYAIDYAARYGRTAGLPGVFSGTMIPAAIASNGAGTVLLTADGNTRYRIWQWDGVRGWLGVSSDDVATNGWRAAGIACTGPSSARVLLLSPAGQARISHFNNGWTTPRPGPAYTLPAGWQAVGIAAPPAGGNSYLLVRNGAVRHQVWVMDPSGARTATYSHAGNGWTASDLAVCGDGTLRVLLLASPTQMRLQKIDGAASTLLPVHTAPAGWEFAGIGARVADKTQVLLRDASFRYRLWTLDGGGRKESESIVFGG